ncbi:MAG: enoyl-CoA hydratase/isomerase family protein [Gammaproteobacteria bacterium]|jgi:enoyl-CoA hydratase/carnithine racemase|nr:enoyl-CoA hydratase/isomerase family protein [Gammaproteobacteria bacterium]MBT4493970.1 enoyl-CoA hydratase/isomerase family protein [Gammaproteobacteria bacterium]MBT7372017.1 enoyl-CoA hydratase/isomerase family protein [Gammaproteobacteria bacterium]
MDQTVKFVVQGSVGIATLTREKSLNSLTLETINQLSDRIYNWLEDDSIACIVLDSSSDRAFCAGADITALYQAIKAGDLDGADAFFTNEYRLDHALHQASKPIVVWGNGVVMGGGLGLLSGCSHRVGTPDNKIAMPEITIGLFPDAGGTWLLSHLPDHLGVFMGLTGCQLTAGDALELNMLDCVLEQEVKPEVLRRLSVTDWSTDNDENHSMISQLLAEHTGELDLPRNLLRHRDTVRQVIADAYDGGDFLSAFEAGLAELQGDDWLNMAFQNYRSGSPTTAGIFVEQLNRARGMTLAETFRLELTIACQCVRHADFPEGVRALLVDKDKNPGWTYPTAAEVPSNHIAGHFVPSWQGQHPLVDLG